MKIFLPVGRKLHLVAECVNIMIRYFSLEKTVTSVTSGGNYDFPAMRFEYEKDFEDGVHSQKVQLYLFEGVGSWKLGRILECLSGKYNFNPRAKFVITGVCLTVNLRKTLRRLFVLDVIFVQVETGDVYRFVPSTLSLVKVVDCGGDFLDTKGNNSLSLLYVESNIYAMCFPCEKPGIEIESLQVILEHFELNHTFHLAPKGKNYKTIWKDHDVFFGTLVIAFLFPGLEVTMPYVFDEAAFFVPLSFNIPRWRYILTVFPFEVWISWVFLSVLLALVWSGTGGFVAVFSSFLEQSVRVTATSVSRKILLVSILSMSFYMNVFFKGRFTYLLNGVSHEDSVKTIREVMEKGLDVGVSTRYIADYLNSTPEVRRYIGEHLVECGSAKLDGCIERAIKDRDMAILYSMKKVKGKKRLFADPQTGRPLLEQMKPSVALMPVSPAFPRGHPSLPFFNQKLMVLRESGIVDLISRKYEKGLANNEGTFLMAMKALSFDHLIGPLFLWVVGCASSFALFLNEIYRGGK